MKVNKFIEQNAYESQTYRTEHKWRSTNLQNRTHMKVNKFIEQNTHESQQIYKHSTYESQQIYRTEHIWKPTNL